MTVHRVIAIASVLLVPAVFAPALDRVRAKLSRRCYLLAATAICLVPVSAPWFRFGRPSPVVTWLIGIAGTITSIRAIEWLARPRYASDRIRVILALTVWPGLDIGEVGIRIPNLSTRISLASSRLAAGLAGCTAGLALTALAQHFHVASHGLLVDSTLKTVEIYLLAGGANHLLVATFGLAGYRIKDGFRYPILARSVLDFWSRYNVQIHCWLKRNIFNPVRRSGRSPNTAVLAVFAFSGFAHELLFVPAALDLVGWQLAFFMLHAAGAILGGGLGRAYQARAARRIPRPIAVAATLMFVLATAPVFVHCLDRLFDLHRDVGGLVLQVIRCR
jgi:hypothetical protein